MAGRGESSSSSIMSDGTKSDVKDLLTGALPLAAIGALIGVACHVGGTLVDAPSQRTKEGGAGGIRAQKDICANYEAVSTDDNLCKYIKALVPFTVIHPNWLPVFLDDVNIIYAAWFRMSEINREALTLIPNYEYYIGPSTGMGRSSTLFDYASSFFGNVTTRISHTVESTKSKMSAAAAEPRAGGNPASSSSKSSQMPANGEAYAVATKRLKALVEEANDLLNVVSMCSYNVAGYSAEFVSICEIFNVYLAQCGIAFLSDPDTYHHKRAKVIVDDQVALVKHVRRTGKLPYEVPPKLEICETPTSSSLLKWWTLMHTMSLSTMFNAACRLGWHSVYNPEPQTSGNDNTTGAETPAQQPGVRYRAANKTQQAKQLKTARGGMQHVNMDAVNRAQSAHDEWNNSAAIEPGHAFLQDANRAREELHHVAFGGRQGKSDASSSAQAMGEKPQASVKRPSLNSSFSEQGKFWIERLKTEGWRSVVKKPWAGFIPSVDDACFLPKTELDVTVVKACLKNIVASCNTRITDMFNTNHRVAEIGVKFYRHWHPSLSDVDDEMAAHVQTLLAMEEEWDSR